MHTETATMVWAQTKVSMHMQKKKPDRHVGRHCFEDGITIPQK